MDLQVHQYPDLFLHAPDLNLFHSLTVDRLVKWTDLPTKKACHVKKTCHRQV